MGHTIRALAAALEAVAFGNLDLEIDAISEPSSASARDLALAMSPKFAAGLAKGGARAAVIGPDMDWQELGLEAAIVAPRPRYAMAGLTAVLDPGPEIEPGIHPSAIIHPTAEIGEGAAVGPFVVIGRNVRIGARARIASHSSIAEHAQIGDDALLLQGVKIGSYVTIGNNLIAQMGATIGGDGMSFVTPEKSTVEQVRENMGQVDAAKQSWTRIHSLGAVTIGDDVEIGCNACIDKGTIRDTQIGSGTKIDNLVHLAHNVVTGEDCLFAALVGIAGSTTLGDRVVLGGQVGVVDNVTVGSDVVAAGGTKILSNVPSGRAVMGYPAVKMETHVETYKAQRRLPRLAKTVAELQKSISKLSGND